MIQINFRDSSPFYEQIKENYIRLIVSGALAAHEKLPSVRELAAQLSINPNTIQRAYRELEQEGYIYKVSGRGTFVSEIDIMDSPRRKEMLEDFRQLVKELLNMSVGSEELIHTIQSIEKGVSDDDQSK